MGGPPMTPLPVDYADIQGLVRFGHGKLKQGLYAVLRIKSAEDARAWLRTAPVTTATATSPPPTAALQVAFTAEGLRALGMAPSVLAGFSAEFRTGMTEGNRSRRLGDVVENDPSKWDWGRPGATPHVLAMFFAEEGQLERFMGEATGEAWRNGFEVVRCLP